MSQTQIKNKADTALISTTLDLSKSVLNPWEKRDLIKLIDKYDHLFARGEHDLGETKLVEHQIYTGNARPIRSRPYRTPHSLRPYISEKIQEMMENGIIQPSVSNWSSPIVLVKKKGSSELRFCADNRALNDVTIKDNYPLKRIEDAFDMLHGSKIFASLDLQSGYLQIPIKKDDMPKTVFITHEGLYEFRKMNFGLTNAPATFQRLMDTVLRGLDWKTCLVYLDDIIIPAKNFKHLLLRLEEIFYRLKAAGLKLKLKKCQFGMTELVFLGHIVSGDGLKVDPAKVEKICSAEFPRNISDLKRFLGFTGFCSKFIFNYAEQAEPLTRLLKKDQFKWNERAQTAFTTLKHLYTKAPILV